MNTDEHGLERAGNGTMKDMKSMKKKEWIMRPGFLHVLHALHGGTLFASFLSVCIRV